MRSWSEIKKRGRRAMERAIAPRARRDVFELEGVPDLRAFYEQGVFPWKRVYRGLYAPWHDVAAPTAANPDARRRLFRMNLAKAACAELAGMVWGEQAALRVCAAGAVPGDDPLNEYVQHVLRESGFAEGAQAMIEKGLALGGAALRVWVEPGSGEGPGVRLGLCAADQFVPLSWDGGRVLEGLFVSRHVLRGTAYTRLEWHRREGGGYVVENELYRAEAALGVNALPRDVLGTRCPLEEAFPQLAERAEVPGRLFAYWRTPVANNLDDDSPLGVSIFANALETLHALDICYDSLVQEFRLGKKKIVVPARFLRSVVDPATGRSRRYFDPGDETFVGLADDDATAGVKDISTELRVEEHVAALNALLSILCLQLGFSANTFSFDREGGLRTATEVVSENSKTYKTIRTVQNQLAPALERAARCVVEAAALCGARWRGRPVAELAAGGYEVKVVFDDGVTQDRQTNLNEGMALVAAGLLSRRTFLTDAKYGQGLSEREAEAELGRIREEGQAGTVIG